MKRLVIGLLVVAVVMTSHTSFAQYLAGGVWGGTQGCDYPVGLAPGAFDDSDLVAEFRKLKRSTQRKLTRAKRRQTRNKRNLAKLEADIKKSLTPGAAQAVLQHMQKGLDLADHASKCSAASIGQTGDASGGTQRLPPGQTGQSNPDATARNFQGAVRTDPFCKPTTCRDGMPDCNPHGDDIWGVYALDGGGMNTSVCSAPESQIARRNQVPGAQAACEAAIQEYATRYQELMADNTEVADLQSQLRGIDRDIDEANDNDEDLDCENCTRHSVAGRVGAAPSTLQTILGAGLIGGLGYLNYRNTRDLTRQAIRTNSLLGWPTDPYAMGISTIGSAYPMIAAGLGLMGAGMGGVGTGGYACAGTIGNPMLGPAGFLNPYGSPYGNNAMYSPYNGGAFGYPASMMPYPYGGGILNGGYGLGNWPGIGGNPNLLAGPVPRPGFGVQLGTPASIAPYPYGLQMGYANGYGYPSGIGGIPTGIGGVALGIDPMAQVRSQVTLQGYGQIAQLTGQIQQIQSYISYINGGYGGGGGYSIAPYPYSGALGGNSSVINGPVPMPGTGTNYQYGYSTTTVYGR